MLIIAIGISDGELSFYATIEDVEFLNNIDIDKISFSKNDLLKVSLRKEQYYSSDKNQLISKYFIDKVINHIKAPDQLQFKVE